MKDNFETVIKENMQQYAAQIDIDPMVKDKVNERIREERTQNMKKGKQMVSMKKIVIGVVVGCLLASTVVIAGGNIVGYVTGISLYEPTYDTYEEVAKSARELGYATKYIESFSNGFQFYHAYIGKTDGINEEGKRVGSFDELWIDYQDPEGTQVCLVADKPLISEDPAKGAEDSRSIGDLTVYYTSDDYKWVPAGYEPTEEELAAEERGELYISSGSEEISYSVYQHVNWVEDGVHYNLFVMDGPLTKEDLFQMSEEILTQ